MTEIQKPSIGRGMKYEERAKANDLVLAAINALWQSPGAVAG